MENVCFTYIIALRTHIHETALETAGFVTRRRVTNSCIRVHVPRLQL